mgnify:CR=1 FL=1
MNYHEQINNLLSRLNNNESAYTQDEFFLLEHVPELQQLYL